MSIGSVLRSGTITEDASIKDYGEEAVRALEVRFYGDDGVLLSIHALETDQALPENKSDTQDTANVGLSE